jgi:hypothetical protein
MTKELILAAIMGVISMFFLCLIFDHMIGILRQSILYLRRKIKRSYK